MRGGPTAHLSCSALDAQKHRRTPARIRGPAAVVPVEGEGLRSRSRAGQRCAMTRWSHGGQRLSGRSYVRARARTQDPARGESPDRGPAASVESDGEARTRRHGGAVHRRRICSGERTFAHASRCPLMQHLRPRRLPRSRPDPRIRTLRSSRALAPRRCCDVRVRRVRSSACLPRAAQSRCRAASAS